MYRLLFLADLVLVLFVNGQQLCPCEDFDGIDKECRIYNGEYDCLPLPEILGGEDADSRDWPYIISLQISIESRKSVGCYSHFCAGALIAPKIVLTAAHCVETLLDFYGGIPKIDVFAAQAPPCRHMPSSRGHPGFRSQVQYAEIHPEWRQNGSETNADLAVLVLNESLPGPYVKLEKQSHNPQSSETLSIAGYGAVNPEEYAKKQLYFMRKLQQTQLQYVKDSLCKFFLDQFDQQVGNPVKTLQYFNNITMICAFNSVADSCQGDSGGPAVRKGGVPSEDVLVGVASWGPANQCTSFGMMQAPGIFARVGAYYTWIQEKILQFQNGVENLSGGFENTSYDNNVTGVGDP